MQKFRPGRMSKICLSLLSLTLLTQTVIGYEEDKVSYLDSVSSSYIQDSPYSDSKILNMNSAEAQAFEATFKLDSAPVITNSQSKVNLSLRDSDLRQALRMIADKAGLNIVFDKSVEGKITLDLNNVTLNDAFLIIFKSTQLKYVLDGNTITVMTLEASKDVAYTRQNMTVLPVKYVDAQSVAQFLNENLFKSNIFGLSNKPIVTSNPRTNQLVVFGGMSDVNAIKRILPVIDTKPMVNSFKVNHTTPAEMANMICSSLFYQKEDNVGATGGGGEGEGEETVITLGSGKVACRDKGDDEQTGGGTNTSLQAFKANPLTIAYFSDLGTVNTYGGSIEQIETIKEFIKEHDKKQLMAYVEISIVELSDEGSKEFSNSWGLWTPFYNLGFDATNGLATISNPTIISDNLIYHSANYNKQLLYQLKYLLNNKKGRVLTNPKIMITNGRKAIIDMTEDYIKTTTSQVLSGSSGLVDGTQKTYDIGQDQGLLIEILAFISPDGYVSMNITPELANEKTKVYDGADIAATLLRRNDIELKNVRIKDGETMILAGLIKESETQETTKFPLLGDLPLVGVFFRDSKNAKTRSEIVIVVTPHIVNDAESVATEHQTYDL